MNDRQTDSGVYRLPPGSKIPNLHNSGQILDMDIYGRGLRADMRKSKNCPRSYFDEAKNVHNLALYAFNLFMGLIYRRIIIIEIIITL